MRVSYYPGCSLHGTAREYGESAVAVAGMVGVELSELADWNCCGASSAHVTDRALATGLAARNLSIAAAAGMDLVVPCAACYSRLKTAEKELLSGEAVAAAGQAYDGSFSIRHLADFFWDQVGEEALRQRVRRPLTGLSPVCYYGCLITRPPKVTDAADPDNPESLDNLLTVLGADVKTWSYKTDCCGASHILPLRGVARRLTRKLLDMAEEAGADSIAVACPMCHMNLDSLQGEVSQEAGREYSLPIFYFTELMALAFGDASMDKQLGRHMVDPRPLLKQRGLI
jgi:heterodisulfide reductase subunit B